MRSLAFSGVIGSLMASTALMSSAAYAQADQNAEAASDARANSNEIIVTAQRRSENLRDVPLTVSAITSKDLEQSNITDTRQLQVAVPGLTFVQYGALAQPAIRGVQATSGSAGNESPIAVYLDGFYQASQIGGIFQLPDTEQIEVLKGPQGTLFGRNATGGAVLIHTRDPSLTEVTGSVTVSDGVFFGKNVKTSNDLSVSGFVSVPIVADKLAISVAGIGQTVPGYMTNDVTGGRYGKIDQYLLRGKILFQPSDNVRFTLTGMISERSDDAGGTYFPLNGVTAAAATDPMTGAPLFPDAIIPTQPWHTAGEVGGSHVYVNSKFVGLTSEFTFPDIGTLTSRTGYAYINSPETINVHAAYSPSCYATVACVNYGYNPGPQRTFQEELSFASEQFGKFSFVAGALYYRDKHKQTQNVNPPNLSNDPKESLSAPSFIYFARAKVDSEAYAFFGEGNLDVTDRLRLIAGIRYNHDKKTGTPLEGPLVTFGLPIPGGSWSSWTPRFSAVYKITPEVNIYATYSKGFKSGTLNADSGAPPANPEKITSYEAGIKASTRGFSFNLSAFWYDYKDLQVQFFDGVRTLDKNAAQVEIFGVDLDGSVQISDTFRIRFAGSWVPHAVYGSYPDAIAFLLPFAPQGAFGTIGMTQVTTDVTGSRIIKTPRFTGSLVPTFNKDIGIGTLGASATIYYSSRYRLHFANRVVAPAYVSIGADLSLTLPDEHWRFSLWGKNLTNKAYFAGQLLSGTADSIAYAPPRQVGLSAKYSF